MDNPNRKRRRESLNDSGVERDLLVNHVTPPPPPELPEHVVAQRDRENEMEENEIEIENKKYIKRLSKGNVPEDLKSLRCTICFKDEFKTFDGLIKHSKVKILFE